MNIEVTKYNFYENIKGPHLKYIESTKKQEVCDHFQCNCTKVVSEKEVNMILKSIL
jgi:hypothetical protein